MKIREALKLDLDKIMENDPAATSRRVVKRTYTGYKSLKAYRYAHWFYEHNMKNLAFYIMYLNKRHTGVEIHPAAKIGVGIFIDHGTGLVIGETTEIGNDCKLFQGVTLGGTGKETGKRHPTLKDGVMVSAGAKVLGPVVIGENSKIGAGSVVLKDVPPNCTVVGVPGRVVRQNGNKVKEMDQVLLPDPIMEEFKRINHRLYEIEKDLGIHTCRYSITIDDNNISEKEIKHIEEVVKDEKEEEAEK